MVARHIEMYQKNLFEKFKKLRLKTTQKLSNTEIEFLAFILKYSMIHVLSNFQSFLTIFFFFLGKLLNFENFTFCCGFRVIKI